jgi:hypothetical protein
MRVDQTTQQLANVRNFIAHIATFHDGIMRNDERVEPVYPSVDGYVVDLDTAFGQQLLDVSLDPWRPR